MKRINVNSQIYVKLTPLGINILRKQFEKDVEGMESLKDIKFEDVYDLTDNVLKISLWKFMMIFGNCFGMGHTIYPIKDLDLYIPEREFK